jgi:hypothetical protein
LFVLQTPECKLLEVVPALQAPGRLAGRLQQLPMELKMGIKGGKKEEAFVNRFRATGV